MKSLSLLIRCTIHGTLVLALLSGCTSFKPVPLEETEIFDRVQVKEQEGVRVSVSVMTRREASAAFGKELNKNEVQPIWLQIENNSDKPLWLMLHGLDPNYFSASEAATLVHRGLHPQKSEIVEHFDALDIERVIPAGSKTEGFVFSNLKLGTKEVRVRLFGYKYLLDFEFFVTVPGLKADWQRTDFESLYKADEIIEFDSPAELRETLESFMCCTTKKDGSGSGDPINLVVIAPSADSLNGFLKAGWDETEIITAGSGWRTFKSFVTGAEYKYSPISPLYVFGRPQDISLQKARDTIHERNHLRLWLSPWRLNGDFVFIGGISRDIGVFWTTRTWNLTSHAIDSEVDEARNYITEDLAAAQAISGYGFVKGVGRTTPDNPRENLLGTPWWSNGLRVVLRLSDEPVQLEEIVWLDWSARIYE